MILAGGCNKRFAGIKKAFHKVGEKTILQRIHTLFASLFKETILVVNEPGLFLETDTLVVTDIDTCGSALAGLHAGLFHASFDWSYVCACDMPFVSEKIIRYLLTQRLDGKQVVMPETRDGLEPLSALYHRACLLRIETCLGKKRFGIKDAFKPERVKQVPAKILETLDPDLRFSFNVNTAADLEAARHIDLA